MIRCRMSMDEDMNFLYATILRSFKFANPMAKIQRSSDYYKNLSATFQSLFEQPTTRIMIAHGEDDPTLILGFLVYEEPYDCPIIHYCYVKAPFRQSGIATMMLDEAGIDILKDTYYSMWTESLLHLDIHQKYRLIYNPYLLGWRVALTAVKGDDYGRESREGVLSHGRSVWDNGKEFHPRRKRRCDD